MDKRMLKSTLGFGIDHIDFKNTFFSIENSPVIYRKQSFDHFKDEYRKAGWLKEDQLLP